ncbi:hypothetical protein Poly41_51760 [Novipirellula artificiosorum]|uniref:Lipoprotein n=1 Tax=Novipirellula artificiosorum TaxID=2528016 RepID=A0A5C6DD10_9BACT|nr:hypothetical protein Poly41_51760 [Novipirellula artificiosorum]
MNRFTTLLLVSAFASCDPVFGQQEPLRVDAGFSGKVAEAMVLRDSIKNGAFEYELEISPPGATQVQQKTTGSYYFDYESERSLHLLSVATRQEGTGEIETRRGVGLQTRETTAIQEPESTKLRVKGTVPGQNYRVMMPFEFRAFGYAFFGNYRNRHSFEEVLSSYLVWHDPQIVSQESGVIHYDAGEVKFSMETEKDYWLSSHEFIRNRYEMVDGTSDGKNSTKNLTTIRLPSTESEYIRCDGTGSPEGDFLTESFDTEEIDCVLFRYCKADCEILSAVVDPSAPILTRLAVCKSSSQTPFPSLPFRSTPLKTASILRRDKALGLFGLDGFAAPLAGSNSDAVVHGQDKDLAVANLAGVSALQNRVDRRFDELFVDRNL